MTAHPHALPATLKSLALAGLAGGIAEVLWVGAYCALMPLSALDVLRQITASVAPSAAHSAIAPALGMVIHLALSIALAIAYALAMGIARTRSSTLAGAIATAVATLAAVWMLNFFVLLPQLNPAFVALMPYPVTLLSKLLFGAAMGLVLHREYANRPAATPAGIAIPH